MTKSKQKPNKQLIQETLYNIITTLIAIELNQELLPEMKKTIRSEQCTQLFRLLEIDISNNINIISLLKKAAEKHHWQSIQLLIAYYYLNKEFSLTYDIIAINRIINEAISPANDYDKSIMLLHGNPMLAWLKNHVFTPRFFMISIQSTENVQRARKILSILINTNPQTSVQECQQLFYKALNLLTQEANDGCLEAQYLYWISVKKLSRSTLSYLVSENIREQAANYLISAADLGHNHAMLELAHKVAYGKDGFKQLPEFAQDLIEKIEKDTKFAQQYEKTLSQLKQAINYIYVAAYLTSGYR